MEDLHRTRWRVGLLLMSAAIGCTTPMPAPPTRGTEESIALPSLTPFPGTVTDCDREVLLSVLRDMLDRAGTPLDVRGAPPTDIHVLAPSQPHEFTTDDLLRRYRPQDWAELSTDLEPSLASAAADLVRRAAEGVSGFTSEELRIQVHKPESPDLPRGIGRWPIPLVLPGYAAQGGLAMVRMLLPWGIHFATGTWVLVLDGSDWRVVVREFRYHP